MSDVITPAFPCYWGTATMYPQVPVCFFCHPDQVFSWSVALFDLQDGGACAVPCLPLSLSPFPITVLMSHRKTSWAPGVFGTQSPPCLAHSAHPGSAESLFTALQVYWVTFQNLFSTLLSLCVKFASTFFTEQVKVVRGVADNKYPQMF